MIIFGRKTDTPSIIQLTVFIGFYIDKAKSDGNLQGRKLHKNISVMVSWNVSIRKASKGILFLKGNSGFSASWAQMKEHEKSKRTSHH